MKNNNCKYCDFRARSTKEPNRDITAIRGSYLKSSDDYYKPYIFYDMSKNRFDVCVPFDAGFGMTGIDNIKYCPMCGEKLELKA